ncbi:MAG: hypothetical protein ACRDAM_00285 [Casimicrobium sp.]
MKMLVAGLIGSGAGAVVLLAYLSLSQQQETKKDIALDKAVIEVQRARFDKDFEEKWNAFDGKPLSKAASNEHRERIKNAHEQLEALRTQKNLSAQHNAKDLEELRAVIESGDVSAKQGKKP